MKKYIFFLIPIAALYALPPIDDHNYINHPEIVKIRKLYNEIENNVQNENYKHKSCADTEEEYASGDIDVMIDADIYIDQNNTIRKYETGGGTGDFAESASYYYDSKGILRFSYQVRNSIADGGYYSAEKRNYFDQNGKSIYANLRTRFFDGKKKKVVKEDSYNYFYLAPDERKPREAFLNDCAK